MKRDDQVWSELTPALGLIAGAAVLALLGSFSAGTRLPMAIGMVAGAALGLLAGLVVRLRRQH